MFVRIEPASRVPIYRQIMDQVKYQIANGTLAPGDRLPSVRELARRLATNQNTIVKVYDLLGGDGWVVRRQGDGTFVARSPDALTRTERHRRVGQILAQAATQAVHFQIDRQELHDLLNAEIDAIQKDRTRHESG
ncbi:MAG TPA: GntR family transcriptional regulator [Phycisphaerae bacterium]|nr:GntR family transcriptional regulator [Phycisphaerae bacterium]